MLKSRNRLVVSRFFRTFASRKKQQLKGDRDMTKEEEVILREKFTKFNIFTRDGNKEVTAPRRMTLGEAMRHFKALAISGIE